MGGMKSYGRIAITNISRVGTLSVNPTCNMPLQVVYNPDSNTYVPDWINNNLIIKPIVYFDGTPIDSGYTVLFKKRDGSSAETPITNTTGLEAVNNNQLVVSGNILKDSVSGIITYLMEVTYNVPKTTATITSTANLTFSLIKNPETVKYASIAGENVFLYNSKQQIQGPSSITLEGHVTNVNIVAWQYKDSAGNWTNYPNTNNPDGINQSTLIVKESDSVFSNDRAIIRLTTNDSDIYDIITISKIRDGAAGGNSVSCILSNESHIVPADSDGNVITLDGASTQLFIYEGGIDVTAEYNVKCEEDPKSSVIVTYNPNSGTYSVQSMDSTVSVASLNFTCTKKDGDSTQAPLYAKFTLSKITAGLDGESPIIYSLETNNLVIHKNASGALNNDSIAFLGFMQEGRRKQQCQAYFYIYETSLHNPSDDDWTLVSQSSKNEVVREYRPTESATAIKCYMLLEKSTDMDMSVAVDSQTVLVVNDGAKGEDGEPGKGGLSIILGNEAELITCDTNATAADDQLIIIPYDTYIGIEKVASTASIRDGLPDGMNNEGITDSSSTDAGIITLKVSKGATLGGTTVLKGSINISVTVDGTTAIKKFTWSKNVKSKDGESAVLFQSYAPNGDVISNKQNSVSIATMLVDGSTIIDPETNTVEYKWYKFDGSDYLIIDGVTSSILTVEPDMVDTMASFKCTATYKSKEYSTYYVVTDRSDPYEVIAYSSIGTQLVNNDKPGVIFTRVMQNGTEIDPIKSTIFSETEPENPNNGDFYYKIDQSTRTCKLMKYDGRLWLEASESDLPKLKYKYFKLDSAGNIVDITTAWREGKAIYFDSADTNPTLDLMVEVSD